MSEPTNYTTEDQFILAKAAIRHVLNAIADDPRKYWLMGAGTESWAQLTTAAAAIWGKPLDEVQKNFQPDVKKYAQYLRELKADEDLLRHCRENGITAERQP